MYPNVRCSNCAEQKEKLPYLVLDCETEDGCIVPKPSRDISKATAIRQDLHRLKIMGWPDLYRYKYIKQEHAPDLHIMQLSMLADEYIEEIQRKKQEQVNGRKKTGRT